MSDDILARLERVERRIEFAVDYLDRLERKLWRPIDELEDREEERARLDREHIHDHVELLERIASLEERERERCEREQLDEAAKQQRANLRVFGRRGSVAPEPEESPAT
jgi:hypothetical protein